MLDALLLLAAAVQQDGPIIFRPDPPPGPMAAEQRTLSQPHPNDFPEGSFPDLAVKDMRIDGDTLHVLVSNEGKLAATGTVRISAQAQFNGFRSLPSDVRIGKLKAGESRWVAIRDFSVKSAAAAPAPLLALQDAASVSASVSLSPPRPAALDRSGQLQDRAIGDSNAANDRLELEAARIARGGPD